jgi:RNase P subunit RPR2
MTHRRKCQRCHGEEFLMTTTSGVVISWRATSGYCGTWFCPNCDWGARCDGEEKA